MEVKIWWAFETLYIRNIDDLRSHFSIDCLLIDSYVHSLCWARFFKLRLLIRDLTFYTTLEHVTPFSRRNLSQLEINIGSCGM